MGAARRTSVVNRHSSHAASTQNSSFSANPKLQKCLDGMSFNYLRGVQTDLITPKHISISYPTADHELIYETIVLFSAVAAFLLQLLHIYRTVWWLPQSYEQNALKFYLVNPYILAYVFSLIAPRWLWTIMKISVLSFLPNSWKANFTFSSQSVLATLLGMLHFYIIFLFASEDKDDDDDSRSTFNRSFKIGCLLYPSFMIAMSCHEKFRSFLELVPSDRSQMSQYKQHSCSSDPVLIRKEAKALIEDFNGRLKSVLYHSHIYAVVCGLLPCCLAQSSVHFDIPIALQHFALIWAGSLTLNAVHAFSPKYCDVLHSSARHLGFWDHLGEGGPLDAQAVEWSDSKVWTQGSVVRHNNEIYCARGTLNAAEPGCIHHKRFYSLFINAALLHFTLLILQVIIVIIQLILLFRSNEWYQMISLSLLQASNGYALFKLMRDTVVIWRLSLAEEMLQNA